jgi:hypothetical protein
MAGGELTLRKILTTPFILHVEAVKDDGGRWVRRASFPELDRCSALAPTAWDAVEALESYLPKYLVALVAAGRSVPLPDDRAPVGDLDAEAILSSVGLDDWVPELDAPIEALAGIAH